jgi:hypothetical protein
MNQDTREITVSLDHLRQALDEISAAEGQAERSMAEGSVRRALDHLNMVNRRLEHTRSLPMSKPAAGTIEQAHNSMRSAWQLCHDALNDWPRQSAQLGSIRSNLEASIERLEQVTMTERSERILESEAA